NEGNHGEDVKEYYFYLDNVPSHAYMKYLYKYPQRVFPYADLVAENQRRSREDPEYELLDTGIFDDDRYFDVFVEYAKAGADDILMLVTVHNRGPEEETVHVLPQLWFRNTWSWQGKASRPRLAAVAGTIAAEHARLGRYVLHAEGGPEWLFCDNETNAARLYGVNGEQAYYKDAFHDHVVSGRAGAVNPAQAGTKAAAHYRLTVPAGGSVRVRLRLTN